jgi:hypothetical protein
MVEQDHRAIKRRVRSSQGSRAFHSAWRTDSGNRNDEYDPQGTGEVVSEGRHSRAGRVRWPPPRSDNSVIAGPTASCSRPDSQGSTLPIMLQISVHDGDPRGRRRHHAFHAGGRKTAATDTMDDPDARIFRSPAAAYVSGTVFGIIVDEYDFPFHIRQHRSEPVHDSRNVFTFVKDRNNDRQIRHGSNDQRFRRKLSSQNTDSFYASS